MRRRVAVDPRALSAHDRTVLAAVGVPAADLDRQQSGSLVDQAARLLEQNSLAMSVAAAAECLGRSPSRIRGAIADGSLYGVKVGRNWLIPVWQLDEATPLPHLRKVIAAIPEGTSAVTLQRVTGGHSLGRAPKGWSLLGLGGSRGDGLCRSPFDGLHDTAAPGSRGAVDRQQRDAPQSASQ